MRISEFSSLVFNDESYKFDQNYGIMQVFGQDDPVKVCVAIDPLAGDKWGDDVQVLFIVKNLATDSYSEYVYGDTGTITFPNAPSYCVVDVMAMLKDNWLDVDKLAPGKYSLTIRRKVSGEEQYKELSAFIKAHSINDIEAIAFNQTSVCSACDLFGQSIINKREFDEGYLRKWCDGGSLELENNRLKEKVEQLEYEISYLKNGGN